MDAVRLQEDGARERLLRRLLDMIPERCGHDPAYQGGTFGFQASCRACLRDMFLRDLEGE